MATTEQVVRMMIGIGKKERRDAGAEFDTLYRDNLRPIYAFVAYRVPDKTAAEDVTAQVFEKAWRSWSRFDPEKATAKTWLYAIARNTVIDYLRSSARRQESSLSQDTASSDSDPQQDLESDEEQMRLYAALAVLEEREREIIALKFGGGMSNIDIAAVVSLTPTNVSTVLYRSLDKLKTQLEGGIEND